MKKIFVLIIFILVAAACENQPWEFPDYNLKAVYFPVQTPVRTLSMGEDRIDNSLDKEYKLDIGVVIGGSYVNKKEWTVDYVVDPTLVDKVYLSKSPQVYTPDNQVLALPASYYTLTPAGTITIPKGQVNGLVRVQLTDAFFNDTIALTGRYVIPLKLTATSADSILQGKAIVPNADIRVVNQWNANQSPKNWTMYGINYVNPYHGTWLHRGVDVQTNKSTSAVTTVTIPLTRPKDIEKDPLIKLVSNRRNVAISNYVGNLSGTAYGMKMTFSNDKGTAGTVTISKYWGCTYNVTGTGTFQDIASSNESLFGLSVPSMYLSYTYDDGTLIHQIKDTLVFRDRGIKYTTNSIVIQP